MYVVTHCPDFNNILLNKEGINVNISSRVSNNIVTNLSQLVHFLP